MDIIMEDLNRICEAKYIPWNNLQGKRVLVTGGTGLIGSLLIKALCVVNRCYDLNLSIITIVRNEEKAKRMLAIDGNIPKEVVVCLGNVESFHDEDLTVDYVVHTAYPTASKYFNAHPVETIKTGIGGTINMLDLAKDKKAEKFVFLSSMEVYGEVLNDELIHENYLGQLNLYSTRTCYPESKRACENICCCYAKEYNMNISVLRLAQTFGPGVAKEDGRVFAMMARCAMNAEDIVLNTPGQSKHPYLYSADAVMAILTVLLKGESNCCYNASNPDTYCSIYEMGQMVAKKIGKNNIKVLIKESETTGMYPPTSYLNLDSSKLMALGWKPTTDLETMFIRMIKYME